MSKFHQPDISMYAVQSVPDSVASQGARWASADATESASPPQMPALDSEVVPQTRRRSFSNAVMRRIHEAMDRCTQPGEVGGLLRREGVNSAHTHVLLALFAVLYLLPLFFEEPWLERYFGAAFIAYRLRVKRFFGRRRQA